MSTLLMAFHGAGPDWAAKGEVVRSQFHLGPITTGMGIDLACPDGPRNVSPLGAGWPVDDSVDDQILAMTAGFDKVVGLGYSSGAFFLNGLMLRHPSVFSRVCSVAGGLLSRDAFRVMDLEADCLFVHGFFDRIVPFGGGVTPVDRTGMTWESFLGPRQTLQLFSGKQETDGKYPLDLIDPKEDGLIPNAIFGERFEGIDTDAHFYGIHELWRVKTWGHIDYVGQHASRKIVEWLLG